MATTTKKEETTTESASAEEPDLQTCFSCKQEKPSEGFKAIKATVSLTVDLCGDCLEEAKRHG
jgi:hypothetical protein